MDGFVFGKAGTTVGYFSFETKEAWQIMAVRLKKRAGYARSQYESYDCNHCLCFGKPSPAQVREKEALEDEWHKLESMAAFAQAKQNTRGPDEVPTQALVDQYRKGNIRGHNTQYDDYNYMASSYTPFYVGGAAGCGGGDGGCGAGCG